MKLINTELKNYINITLAAVKKLLIIERYSENIYETDEYGTPIGY